MLHFWRHFHISQNFSIFCRQWLVMIHYAWNFSQSYWMNNNHNKKTHQKQFWGLSKITVLVTIPVIQNQQVRFAPFRLTLWWSPLSRLDLVSSLTCDQVFLLPLAFTWGGRSFPSASFSRLAQEKLAIYSRIVKWSSSGHLRHDYSN